MQLLTTLKDWLSMIDDGKPVDVMYLDLQKAFDKVPHRTYQAGRIWCTWSDSLLDIRFSFQ